MPAASHDTYRPPTDEELLEQAEGRLKETLVSAGDMYVAPETVALVEQARDLKRARSADPREGASIIVIDGKEHLLAQSAPPSAIKTAKAFSDAAKALRLPQTDRNKT